MPPDPADPGAAPAVAEPTLAPAAPAPAAPEPAPAAPEPAPAAPVEPAAPTFTPSLLEEGAPLEPTEPAPAAKPAEPAPAAEGEPKPPGEPAAPAPEPGPVEAAPVYEFAYPDGFNRDQVDSERLNEFTGLLGENKVTPPAAQKLLDMHVAEVSRVAAELQKAQWDVFNRQQETSIAEVRSDEEIGGARFVKSMRNAARAIEQHGGSPEEQQALKQMLTNTGAGNNRLLIRLLSRLGRDNLQEGSPVPANPARTRPANPTERGYSRYAGSNTPGAT